MLARIARYYYPVLLDSLRRGLARNQISSAFLAYLALQLARHAHVVTHPYLPSKLYVAVGQLLVL